MKNNLSFAVTFFLLILLAISCQPKTGNKINTSYIDKDIEMVTSEGTIILRLNTETPLHRDNFIKLVRDGFYNDVLFHRVIEKFVIQAGDPESRTAGATDTLGSSDLPYTVPFEFHQKYFHKRGALGAAREDNADRSSSSTQFYIVQGKVYSDSLMAVATDRMNFYLARNKVMNDEQHKELMDTLFGLYERDNNPDSISLVNDQIKALAESALETMDRQTFPEKHREIYQTVGGVAHLDRSYTIFGEVIQGMDIVDKIAAQETNEQDRPVKDARILSTRFIKRQ